MGIATTPFPGQAFCMSPHAPIIAPSILACDFGHFSSESADAIRAGGDWIHCDIMDGHFVPNISFGADVVKAVSKSTPAPLDVHLMISRPDIYWPRFHEAGAAMITVHVEADHDVAATLKAIRAAGCKAGLAINPPSEFSTVEPFLDQIDLLLVMTVNPGFGGQKFIHETVKKIEFGATWRAAHGATWRLEVDGGIAEETAGICGKAGADTYVAGSSVFGAADRAAAIAAIRANAAAH